MLADKRAAKEERLRAVTGNLMVAWGLSAVCGLGHLVQAWGAGAPGWLRALNAVPVHAALSAAALLGEAHMPSIYSGFGAVQFEPPFVVVLLMMSHQPCKEYDVCVAHISDEFLTVH
jgi:hypothetical protein